jgi:hypothetical protein
MIQVLMLVCYVEIIPKRKSIWDCLHSGYLFPQRQNIFIYAIFIYKLFTFFVRTSSFPWLLMPSLCTAYFLPFSLTDTTHQFSLVITRQIRIIGNKDTSWGVSVKNLHKHFFLIVLQLKVLDLIGAWMQTIRSFVSILCKTLNFSTWEKLEN